MKIVLLQNMPRSTEAGSEKASHAEYNTRVAATCAFVERHGGEIVVVQDGTWLRSRLSRLTRPTALLREIERSAPDVVMMHYPNYPFFWSHSSWIVVLRSIVFTRMLRRWASRRGVSIILDYRDLLPDYRVSLPIPLFRVLERSVFTSADEIWASSPGYGRSAVERFNLDPAMVRTVLNGAFEVNGSPRPAPNPAPRFVYTGGLQPKERGIEQLIEVVNECADLPCEFVICGPNGDWLKPRLAAPNARLVGNLPREQVMDLLRDCDVGMIPIPASRYYELNFPLKLPEYICSGLAVLATDRVVISEFISNTGVGLSAPIEEWPAIIRRLVNDGSAIVEYRRESIAQSPQLLWDNIYDSAFAEFNRADIEARCTVSDTPSPPAGEGWGEGNLTEKGNRVKHSARH